MILLQIVMVSPGTLFVKTHESQSRTNESQLKNTSPSLKTLEPLCNQTFNLKTDSKTLYYSILKLKYSPFIGEFFVYVFCLINICSSLSNVANKIKPLNIEKA